MITRIIHPPLALSNHVKYFWSVEVDALSDQFFSINTFVDDSSGIIFLQPKDRIALVNKGQPVPNAFVYGQTMVPSESPCLGSFKALGVLFYPHSINELFNIVASQFTNEMIYFENFASKDFVNQLMDTEDFDNQVQLISNFLVSRLVKINTEDKLIKHCINKIKSAHGILQVKDLYSFYGLSERQFERRFQAVIGVSPRHYIKVIRFREGINRIRSGKYKRLSQIAHELNYADQSHFIRHIKDLSGINPKVLRDQLDDDIINLMFVNH
jgi:AraC-like DNA-binding protein